MNFKKISLLLFSSFFLFGCSQQTSTSPIDQQQEHNLDDNTHKHTFVKHDPVEPTCDQAGTIAHLTCECGMYFNLEKEEIKKDDIKIQPLNHDLYYINEKPATCLKFGMKAHYICTHCDKLFDDELHLSSDEDLVIAPLDHNFSEVDYSWNINGYYYECTASRKCTNPGCNFIEKETVLAEYFETLEANCVHYSKGYWYATFVNPNFSDAQTNDTIYSKEIGLHQMEHVYKKYPTCEEDGIEEHYRCKNCDLKRDLEGREINYEEDIIIPKLGHRWSYINYTWDLSSFPYKCRAYARCTNDGNHELDKTVEATVNEIKESTCSKKGYTQYIAKFDSPFTSQTHSEDLDFAEHEYELLIDNMPYYTTYSAFQTFKNDSLKLKLKCKHCDNEIIFRGYDKEVEYSHDPLTVNDTNFEILLHYKGITYSTFIQLTINKKVINTPNKDSSIKTYNGQSYTYNVPESDYYTVSGTTRTDAGEQSVIISLIDKENTVWSNGSSEDLLYNFKIYQKPTTLNGFEDCIFEYHCGASPTFNSVYSVDGLHVNIRCEKVINIVNNITTEVPLENLTAGTYYVYFSCESEGNFSGTTVKKTMTVSHSYTQKVINPLYLKQSVNCHQDAEYYYSCLCGETNKKESFIDESQPRPEHNLIMKNYDNYDALVCDEEGCDYVEYKFDKRLLQDEITQLVDLSNESTWKLDFGFVNQSYKNLIDIKCGSYSLGTDFNNLDFSKIESGENVKVYVTVEDDRGNTHQVSLKVNIFDSPLTLQLLNSFSDTVYSDSAITGYMYSKQKYYYLNNDLNYTGIYTKKAEYNFSNDIFKGCIDSINGCGHCINNYVCDGGGVFSGMYFNSIRNVTFNNFQYWGTSVFGYEVYNSSITNVTINFASHERHQPKNPTSIYGPYYSDYNSLIARRLDLAFISNLTINAPGCVFRTLIGELGRNRTSTIEDVNVNCLSVLAEQHFEQFPNLKVNEYNPYSSSYVMYGDAVGKLKLNLWENTTILDIFAVIDGDNISLGSNPNNLNLTALSGYELKGMIDIRTACKDENNNEFVVNTPLFIATGTLSTGIDIDNKLYSVQLDEARPYEAYVILNDIDFDAKRRTYLTSKFGFNGEILGLDHTINILNLTKNGIFNVIDSLKLYNTTISMANMELDEEWNTNSGEMLLAQYCKYLRTENVKMYLKPLEKNDNVDGAIIGNLKSYHVEMINTEIENISETVTINSLFYSNPAESYRTYDLPKNFILDTRITIKGNINYFAKVRDDSGTITCFTISLHMSEYHKE